MRRLPRLALVVASLVSFSRPVAGQVEIFADGFEHGDTCSWSWRAGAAESCAPVPKTVHDLQLDQSNGPVALSGVVLTARSADGRHCWVSDFFEAMELRGVFVFRGAAADPLGPEFTVGATLDLTGYAREYDPSPPGNTLTEVAWAQPVLTGTGSEPLPFTGMTASTLGSIDGGELFEGVLVELAQAAVVAIDSGDRLTLGDGTGTIEMDDLAFDYSAATYPVGTCFSTVVGVIHEDGVTDRRQILPRSAADLVLGSGCAPLAPPPGGR